MARPSKKFVCQSCGAVSTRWAGKCDSCGAWNSLAEEAGETGGIGGRPNLKIVKTAPAGLVSLQGSSAEIPRIRSGIGEFDLVCGGGLVPGSALLIGGDPGIGKSTLLLQAAAAIAEKGGRVVYFSGEEAVAQVRLRAARLGLAGAPVELGAETDMAAILAALSEGETPQFVIIDSIQTLWDGALDSAPGTVSQVRATAQGLIRFAKSRGTAVALIGHVTKDGQIAGPRVVEHMVDTVMYFEGERGHQYRILRTVKNRFGPADEIGVFEMGDGGLAEVKNPSQLFLSTRSESQPGSAVYAGMEGTRPVLMEIQALVAPSPLGTPRRAVVGWDGARLAMVLAVLEARCGVRMSGHDVYLNVAGGLRINEPAADLAVAAALVSSLTGAELPKDEVWFGEISLSGAVRPVGHAAARLREARKLGFERATLAAQPDGKALPVPERMRLDTCHSLADLTARIAANAPRVNDRDPEPLS